MSKESKKLAIISHTEHYVTPDGKVVGWGPTISEINQLAKDFSEIYHIAFIYPGNPPLSALPYTSSSIKFIPISPIGGKGLYEKLKIVMHIPQILRSVHQTLKEVDVFQLRAPTGMGVFLIPYLTFFSKKNGWYKYAGNWNQDNPPLGYAFQRWILKKQSRKVTLNGVWPNQPKHCITFENPCLTMDERTEGLDILNLKSYNIKNTFCFIGRLEDAKGVQRIIDAFGMMKTTEKIAALHFIGDGENLQLYKDHCRELNLPAIFHGSQSREQVFNIYKKSHFILLPSTASEGFPKVIAEAMNFGCIPIVSNVSSIGQYVNSENGFIVSPLSVERLYKVLKEVLEKQNDELQKLATNGHYDVVNFTFDHYRRRIQGEIVN